MMKRIFEQLKDLKTLLLLIIAIGIWVIVAQNLSEQDVCVNGGYVDVGGYVGIDNTVAVDIQAINGHRNVFFNNPSQGDEDKYYLIPVTSQ